MRHYPRLFASCFALSLSLVAAGCPGTEPTDGGPDTEEDAGAGPEEDAGPGPEEDAGPGPEEDAGPGPEDETIVDIAVGDDNFDTLVAALTAADLVDTLSEEGPFTVFAPTDAAFEALPGGLVDGLLNDIPALTGVLQTHVIADDVDSSEVIGLTTATTLNGDIDIQVDGSTVVINGTAQVTDVDIEGSNGRIHVVDGVIMKDAVFPGTVVDALSAYPRFSSLVGAVADAGLVETLANPDGTFTVLAPTNGAFEQLGDISGLSPEALGDILTYHVLPIEAPAATVVGLTEATTVEGSDISIAVDNGVVTINGTATVTYTDIQTDNGVIHVIDRVLSLPLPSILDIAVENEDFSTLETAVTTAGIETLLDGEGPLTVFAPTNAAFDLLPAGLVDALLGDVATLTSILQLHVIDGTAATEAMVVGLDSATTLNGDVTIQVEDGKVFLNGTTEVIDTDIEASNGIVHVLDSVLVPDSVFPGTIVDALASYPRFSSLVGAVGTAELVDALSAADAGLTVFAPTNAAFEALGDISDLAPADLANILTYHVVGLEAPAADVLNLATVTTLNGAPVSIDIVDGGVVLNGNVNVTYTDIQTTNGIIHVIDTVLSVPGDIPTVATEAGFSELAAALGTADLVTAVAEPNGPYTVFAPTNDAFGLLPAGLLDGIDTGLLSTILLHHVTDGIVDSNAAVAATSVEGLDTSDIALSIDGETLVLNGTAQVTATDVAASNGLIHVIDGVILPQDVEFPGTIVDALSAYPRFSSLVSQVVTADLASTLADTTGPEFTVFAPTNRAFEALGDISNLSQAELQNVLLYHVVSGRVLANTVVTLTEATTANPNADTVAIDTTNGVVLNGNVNVTFTDIETSNGVIHVIDAVLTPPN